MDRYFVDFETKSDLDINKVGAMKYLHTPHSDIVCMSYAVNPPPYGQGKLALWLPGTNLPFQVYGHDCRVYSFNALFEYRVWNTLGKKYVFGDLPLSKMVDIQALCARYTFPVKLESAAKVLQTPIQKDPKGKALMNKITQPPFKYTKEELHAFYRYCMTDTESMLSVLAHLPADHLSDEEQEIWEVTQSINLRGMPIDLPLVKRIWAVTNYYRDREIKKIPEKTEGKVSNVTQVAAVRSYCAEYGCDLPNLQADTVEAALDEEQCEEVRWILEMRQEFSQSSIAKYKRLLEMVYEGRIHDNLGYHRASTGRWGGMGFQAHNLPRATLEDVEAAIDGFYSTSILDKDPMWAAKALIRSCISAPEHKVLGVADYKSIENVIIAWVAGEERVLDLHRKGLDEYKDFAADLFSIKYDEVTKAQRTMCKPIILGAGYNLGAVGLVSYADGYGVYLTKEQGQVAIDKYRSGHPKIRGMWYALRDGAINAILSPGERFSFPQYHLISFICQKDRIGRMWLILTLPSGRSLFYPDPEVKEDTFGLIPTHMGINSKNKQWQRLKLIPGRITENIVQALARDILAQAKVQLEKTGYDVILSVHDETVTELLERDAEQELDNIIRIMCLKPIWCPDLPLNAEGECMRRYKKL